MAVCQINPLHVDIRSISMIAFNWGKRREGGACVFQSDLTCSDSNGAIMVSLTAEGRAADSVAESRHCGHEQRGVYIKCARMKNTTHHI
jgi:hypothetical protein